MNWQHITTNWKTSLAGLITFLFTIPSVYTAVHAWALHASVDWRPVLMDIALSIGGLGLVAAKDSTTHSTPQEVQKAGTKNDV